VVLAPARGGVTRLVRKLESRPSALVFLTVPDSAIAGLAAEIARHDTPSSVAFIHASGALGLDALGVLRRHHEVGSFHPLQSFPRPRAPEAFKGILVGIDASDQGLKRRRARLARMLGARPREVGDADRVIYHAAAVFASNFIIALVDEATALLREIGWTQKEAADGLRPLMEKALAGALERGPVAALTGPIRRGDVDTVASHVDALAALERRSSAAGRRPLDVYRMLGRIALEIAKDAGLEPAAAGRIERALTRDVAATRRRRQR